MQPAFGALALGLAIYGANGICQALVHSSRSATPGLLLDVGASAEADNNTDYPQLTTLLDALQAGSDDNITITGQALAGEGNVTFTAGNATSLAGPAEMQAAWTGQEPQAAQMTPQEPGSRNATDDLATAFSRMVAAGDAAQAGEGRVYRGKALIVDPRGPSRLQGEGVRVMGMMLDLEGKECGMEVDVLANTNDYESIRSGWSNSVQEAYLSSVHFIKVSDYNKGLVNLSSYDRIIIGGKADLMRPGGAGVVSSVIADLVAMSGGDHLSTTLRSRTSAFWDDVPFERCVVDNSCATVAPTVAQLAGAVSTFYVLTAEDASRMSSHMRSHGIQPLAMRVWPMRIANMAKVLPEERFMPDTGEDVPVAKKRFALMMGNHHPVNTKNLEELFDSGALNDICNEIEKRESPVKLLLTGAMTAVANRLLQSHRQVNTKCVEIREGFVSNEELATTILPQTRAIMNPFFFDVKSGISVKSFEAIMEGFPLVTSYFGLHGLNDIPECIFPQPTDPMAASSFKDFLLTHIVDDDGPLGYRNFSTYFSKASENCVRGQNIKYPVQQICKD